MNTEKFSFRHAHKSGILWVNGPWIVEGPNFKIQLDDRTEAALLTRKLNESWGTWREHKHP